MNTLAYFIHSKINGSRDDSEKDLSGLEKLAWMDLQKFFTCSPQDVAEMLNMYSPAEWPVVDYPLKSAS